MPRPAAISGTYVKKLNDETGITMILTTHYMEEADALSHRILILDRGRIVALDTPSVLKDVVGGDVIELVIGGDATAFVNFMRSTGWVTNVVAERDVVRLSLDKAESHVAPVVQAAVDSGVSLSVGEHQEAEPRRRVHSFYRQDNS